MSVYCRVTTEAFSAWR